MYIVVMGLGEVGRHLLNVLDRCNDPMGLLRAAVDALRPDGVLLVATVLPFCAMVYEGVKGKVVSKYILNFTTCSLCGQCVESCKFGALRFSKDYNLASPRKDDFIFDLINRLKEKS